MYQYVSVTHEEVYKILKIFTAYTNNTLPPILVVMARQIEIFKCPVRSLVLVYTGSDKDKLSDSDGRSKDSSLVEPRGQGILWLRCLQYIVNVEPTIRFLTRAQVTVPHSLWIAP